MRLTRPCISSIARSIGSRPSAGGQEHHEEGVALGADDDAFSAGEGRAEDAVVVLEELRILVPEALDQSGTSLDVTEQERHGSGGKAIRLDHTVIMAYLGQRSEFGARWVAGTPKPDLGRRTR